ncbi:alanine--tRNA ligase [bacterium]|jgi:alanyl-tRNA synthetase|nr:alanine--tRNA ligase [bacterium]MBT4495735.1 alanine--tRNA ligase [bacterium]MBT4764153.1 alanine--tRNA ligase [bacterium]MBT5401525.1 alanine--tRNA ligase [bacterium]MBT5942516.1 alanine--tRNA ligase [bacterium]
MTINEVRAKYLEFFESKDHVIIPSASLIPENDPSVLFTTAGMHPLVPFLMGETHPAGKKLTDAQKCIRTGDIDEVGDNSHLTFFEMMGNWSLGDYWKEESIKLSYEFITSNKWLGLDKDKIAVSVFKGDSDCPFDQESYDTWIKLGINEERIAKLGKDDNWWPAGGHSVGPQGPDSEIFYWTGQGKAPSNFNPEDSNWFEIWNNVFLEFEKPEDGKYIPLKQKNVDTGLGLERVAAIMQGKSSVYELEGFKDMIEILKTKALDYNETSARIISDHIRAACLIMSEPANIIPSNLDQGYVVRKLVRRAIRHAKKIGITTETDVTTPLVNIVIDQYGDIYPELKEDKQRIINELNFEEDTFEKTLEKGLKEFDKLSDNDISGKDAFNLYSTYGFPLEITQELAKEKSIKVDEKSFNTEFIKHQELSKTATKGKFKGGMVGHSENSIKYHTATHLLHQALKEVLGDHVEQRGSNINDERLRFDFSHSEKMTDEEKKQVESLVNNKISEGLEVSFEELTVDEAKKQGAIGLFSNKYGNKVKVYSVGDYSKEICGGPHVESIADLGNFKIVKESASSKGIRRIKAILE